ncbi:uncharacterized protein LOC127378937 [Dicentrarchus labrax]|uniref:uncharacterized protein LOC127378937 n=1 Tax=Dicentrarchus labrax TaxID=13489 RepID=UPI0021F64509|nr:uncharacterized protein LOC127378937 [Dicentrarchus labrax]
MLDDTKEILYTELVQSTEATSSGAMEPLGFRRGMTELLDLGLEVEVMITDRSSSIRKIMREQYPNIQHEFDIWHTAKGFWNKILTKGKKKTLQSFLHGPGQCWFVILQKFHWFTRLEITHFSNFHRSVVNHMWYSHMWYSCATSKGDIEALQNCWKSITHHVCSEHEWRDDDGKQHRCDHPPLTPQDQRMRMWIDKDSVALQALSSLVLNERLLKDLNQIALFKHTGPLENFDSALLKYLPKRPTFSYYGMRERCHLAILDHNENTVKRKQATTVTGFGCRFQLTFGILKYVSRKPLSICGAKLGCESTGTTSPPQLEPVRAPRPRQAGPLPQLQRPQPPPVPPSASAALRYIVAHKGKMRE